MYVQNSNAFSYSPRDEAPLAVQAKPIEQKNVVPVTLENFSEKAILVFKSVTAGYTAEQKADAKRALHSIGKAAAFASMNGFESQEERLVISQYFGNFSGVLSDDAIKKMIHTKLDNPNFENRQFLEKFVSALDSPLQRIDIKV